MSYSSPYEPLDISAPLMHDAALRLCSDDCRAYHAGWQYWRYLGAITTLKTNAEFLLKTFRELAETEQYRRILISGSADYAMLAHLLWAFRQEGIEPEVTLVDICETPLWINRWYAERVGLKINTVQSDILQYQPEQPFDLICTHSFLQQFSPDSRLQLVKNWYNWLRPQGRCVFVQTLRTMTTQQHREHAEHSATALREQVLQCSAPSNLAVPQEVLAEYAYQYRLHRHSHLLSSEAEVRELLTRSGLDMQSSYWGGEQEQNRDRSTYAAKSQRLCVIAQRP